MTTADIEVRALTKDPHTFEVLGRVLTVLADTPGPLAECLAFRLWPMLGGGGYIFSWYGIPTVDEVVEYLLCAAADDDATDVLRPGDIRRLSREDFTTVDVLGVQFQLRREPMFAHAKYAAMEHYWRGD
ncbi:hypothetical protein ACH498_25065 [Rhodococcus erythropolis]